jgi:hypothetical protein
MRAKRHGLKLLAMAVFSTLFLICVTGAQAAMVNWTVTEWDADTGLSFIYDQNSKYDLIDAKVSLQEDEIQLPESSRIVGTIYEFVIPNFFDPLPQKTVAITLSGANGGAQGLELATVLDVFGADSSFTVPGPAVPVKGEFVKGTTSPEVVTELWNMFPNPDFEHVKVWAPAEFELQNIKIETQSVPLPPAVLLFGSALVGMVTLFRRRRD